MSDALDKVIYGIKRILLNAVEQVTAKGGVNFVGPWTSEETQNAAGETVLNLTYTPASAASNIENDSEDVEGENVAAALDNLQGQITAIPGASRVYLREYEWGAFNYLHERWINPNIKWADGWTDNTQQWFGVPEDCFIDEASVQTFEVAGGALQQEWTLWIAPPLVVSGAYTFAASDMQVIRPANSGLRLHTTTLETPIAIAAGSALAVFFTMPGGAGITGGPSCEFRMRSWITP